MRFYDILYRKYKYFGLLLLCLLLTGEINAQKNQETKARPGSVTLKVVDEDGTTISKVQVVVGEGNIRTETDENGKVSFEAYPDDIVTISIPGYEKNITKVNQII